MIDKKPTPGNWTEYVEHEYRETSGNHAPNYLSDTPPLRKSAVLDINGDPMIIDVPRRALGFDLTPTKRRRS